MTALAGVRAQANLLEWGIADTARAPASAEAALAEREAKHPASGDSFPLGLSDTGTSLSRSASVDSMGGADGDRFSLSTLDLMPRRGDGVPGGGLVGGTRPDTTGLPPRPLPACLGKDGHPANATPRPGCNPLAEALDG